MFYIATAWTCLWDKCPGLCTCPTLSLVATCPGQALMSSPALYLFQWFIHYRVCLYIWWTCELFIVLLVLHTYLFALFHIFVVFILGEVQYLRCCVILSQPGGGGRPWIMAQWWWHNMWVASQQCDACHRIKAQPRADWTTYSVAPEERHK